MQQKQTNKQTTHSNATEFYSVYFVLFLGYKCNVKGKGKAILLQAWTGPEGSSKLRLPDFKTVGT